MPARTASHLRSDQGDYNEFGILYSPHGGNMLLSLYCNFCVEWASTTTPLQPQAPVLALIPAHDPHPKGPARSIAYQRRRVAFIPSHQVPRGLRPHQQLGRTWRDARKAQGPLHRAHQGRKALLHRSGLARWAAWPHRPDSGRLRLGGSLKISAIT